MEKEILFVFTNNDIVGANRKKPLELDVFLHDLKQVFEKHKINSIQNGFIGFDNEGKFGLLNTNLDISEK